MTPSDPDDLPTPFPAWMRAADPRLAAAETNGLYRAFRLRRPVPVRGPLAAFVRALVFAGAGLGVAVIGYGWWLCVIAVPLGMAKEFVAALKPSWGRCRLPESLGAMLARPESTHPQAALDIACVPAPAEELLECLYLEARERQAWLVRDAMAFGASLFAGIYAEALDYHRLPAPFLLAPVAAFLFLAWCVSRATRGFLGAAFTAIFVCRPIHRRRRVTSVSNPVLRAAAVASLLVTVGFVVGCALVSVGLAISSIITEHQLPYKPAFAPVATGLQVALGMLLLQFFARPGVASPAALPLLPAEERSFPGLAALIVREDRA